MDKISTSIFECELNDELTSANISSETNLQTNTNHEINFKTIVALRETKLVNTLHIYLKYYNACIATINDAIKKGKMDVFFKIPAHLINKYYNANDCIDFICNKLNQHNVCTAKINNQTIFITWINIQV
jgi:hypothetical protein